MRLAAIVCGVLALLPAGCGITGRSIVGAPGESACDAGMRSVNSVCVGEGSLAFTLTWDQPGDLDLHVVTPGGHEIYFGAATAEGGTLDVDDRVRTGPENAFWSGAPPAGNYVVCVVPFAIPSATNFEVTVRRNGAMVQQWTGMRMTSTGNQLCSASSQFLVGVLPVM
ncbi:MAG: hypothetical protein WCJ30_05615 [Deltaproteobacteria bacterium]